MELSESKKISFLHVFLKNDNNIESCSPYLFSKLQITKIKTQIAPE